MGMEDGMARLTPEELRQRKEAKKLEREEQERKAVAIQEAANRKKEEHARQLEVQKEEAGKQRESLDRVKSVITALYLEIDKLNKKAPGMTISQLTLEKVNKAIKSSKDLMQNEADVFINDITEFVPAGDMPEYRDVTLVLGQIIAGLKRFEEGRRLMWHKIGIQ
jgi:hypothetical protein